MTYSFQRGEDILLALDIAAGDPDEVTAAEAWIKPAAGAAPRVEMEIISREASGSDPAGWTLFLAGASSAALAAGLYIADARFEIGGGVVITDPANIRIVNSASGG